MPTRFQFRHVCLEAVAATLPELIVSSDLIEQQLEPVYDRLELPVGRLEMFTGIRERRFFADETRPSAVSAVTAETLLAQSGFDRSKIGALVHGSVSRDQLEPATACAVHHAAGLPSGALVFDLSNACLGLLNGLHLVGTLIESGQIDAGIVVGTETGRNLVDNTIRGLLENPEATRQDVKDAFASLTIGSGSAGVLLCHRRLSRTGTSLRGGAWLADTSQHELCQGGIGEAHQAAGSLSMRTDSEGMLNAGVALASRLWPEFLATLDWTAESIRRVCTHQVGKAHRKRLLDALELPAELDFPTVERFGNTGAAALPMALALATRELPPAAGDRIALLGIGSGLNSLMFGVEWGSGPANGDRP